MIALLIIIGLLIVASIYVVVWVVLFVVATVRFRKGKIHQKDLDEASELRREIRAERRRRLDAGYHATNKLLGFE